MRNSQFVATDPFVSSASDVFLTAHVNVAPHTAPWECLALCSALFAVGFAVVFPAETRYLSAEIPRQDSCTWSQMLRIMLFLIFAIPLSRLCTATRTEPSLSCS